MANTIELTSTVKTTAIFSKDSSKRYLLKMEWDDKKPKAGIIMIAPSVSDSLILDTTSVLVRNNCVQMGLGSVAILNMFCTIGSDSPQTDKINSCVIKDTLDSCDIIIVAYGRGTSHLEEKEKLLKSLEQYKDRMYSIVDSAGQRFSHPLSPRARHWNIEKL